VGTARRVKALAAGIDKEAAMGTVREREMPARDFTLPGADTRPVNLGGYRGRNVVLAFYPADWMPVCTHELSLFQETVDGIRARECRGDRYQHRHLLLAPRLGRPAAPDLSVAQRLLAAR
jgi:hypothetical protein